jgi:hypothetical protein
VRGLLPAPRSPFMLLHTAFMLLHTAFMLLHTAHSCGDGHTLQLEE